MNHSNPMVVPVELQPQFTDAVCQKSMDVAHQSSQITTRPPMGLQNTNVETGVSLYHHLPTNTLSEPYMEVSAQATSVRMITLDQRSSPGTIAIRFQDSERSQVQHLLRLPAWADPQHSKAVVIKPTTTEEALTITLNPSERLWNICGAHPLNNERLPVVIKKDQRALPRPFFTQNDGGNSTPEAAETKAIPPSILPSSTNAIIESSLFSLPSPMGESAQDLSERLESVAGRKRSAHSRHPGPMRSAIADGIVTESKRFRI